jgi:glycerol-3-phosphate O-acyltransferase
MSAKITESKRMCETVADNTTSRLDEINNIINGQVCYDTIDKMSDEKLIEVYKSSKSVQILTAKIRKKLEKYIINIDNLSAAVDELIIDLIPAGTKSSKLISKT